MWKTNFVALAYGTGNVELSRPDCRFVKIFVGDWSRDSAASPLEVAPKPHET